MPLYRHKGQLIFFAHVPKCAGTSVTEYLQDRFGQPAFEDRAFLRDPANHPWTRSSPQHITTSALDRILPMQFIDHSLAVVRHPVARLASVYGFQKRSQKKIGRFTSFSRWLKTLPAILDRHPYRYDGHTLQQTRFVPDGAYVFRLEDGLDPFIAHLDEHFGEADDLVDIGYAKKAKKNIVVTPADIELIRDLYAADFERFGYE